MIVIYFVFYDLSILSGDFCACIFLWLFWVSLVLFLLSFSVVYISFVDTDLFLVLK